MCASLKRGFGEQVFSDHPLNKKAKFVSLARKYLHPSGGTNYRKLVTSLNLGDNLTDLILQFAFVRLTNNNIQAAVEKYSSPIEEENEHAFQLFGYISCWDVSTVTDMQYVFYFAQYEGKKQWKGLDLTQWDVSKVTNMTRMFYRTDFNGRLDSWDVSNVRSMNGMFACTSEFNQPLNSWKTNSLNCTVKMFQEAAKFNQPLDAWNMRKVMDATEMFREAVEFNSSVSSWTFSEHCLTSIHWMFRGAKKFCQPLPWLHRMLIQRQLSRSRFRVAARIATPVDEEEEEKELLPESEQEEEPKLWIEGCLSDVPFVRTILCLSSPSKSFNPSILLLVAAVKEVKRDPWKMMPPPEYLILRRKFIGSTD